MPISKITNDGTQCSVELCVEGTTQQTTTTTGADTYTQCGCEPIDINNLISGAFPMIGLGIATNKALTQSIIKRAEGAEVRARTALDKGQHLLAATEFNKAGQNYSKANENVKAAVSFHQAFVSADKAIEATMPPDWSDADMPPGRRAVDYWKETRLLQAYKSGKTPIEEVIAARSIVNRDRALFRAVKGELSEPISFEYARISSTLDELVRSDQPAKAIADLNEFITSGGVKYTLARAHKWARKNLPPQPTIREGTYPSFLKEWRTYQNYVHAAKVAPPVLPVWKVRRGRQGLQAWRWRKNAQK